VGSQGRRRQRDAEKKYIILQELRTTSDRIVNSWSAWDADEMEIIQ
jgi:hypothetical protein